jgi:hypothetical protein
MQLSLAVHSPWLHKEGTPTFRNLIVEKWDEECMVVGPQCQLTQRRYWQLSLPSLACTGIVGVVVKVIHIELTIVVLVFQCLIFRAVTLNIPSLRFLRLPLGHNCQI